MATSASSKTGVNDDNVIFGANQNEMERLDMQHKVVLASMPELVQAPLDFSKPGLKILDQATGSGIWIRDLRETAGDHHTYVGTDIEDQYFPQSPPSDTSYHHQSMTDKWPAEWNGTFDLVHSRMALPGVGMTPLKDAVEGLIGLVKPGGYIQLVEMEWDGWDVGPAGTTFHDAGRDLFSMVSGGQGVDLREKVIPILEAAGLDKIEHKIFKVKFGARADEKIRKVSEASLLATATSISESTKMLPPISVPREKLDTLPADLAKENHEQGFESAYFTLWAQKPISS